MNKTRTMQTKMLAGSVGLGRCCIDDTSITMDGSPLPVWVTLNARAGTVERTDGNYADKTLYEFEFDHFAPAEIEITTNKDTVIADGVDEVVITVACEDPIETTVSLAVYNVVNGVEILIGTFNVAVTNGTGQTALTYAEAGVYLYRADSTILDDVWNLPKFETEQPAQVEAVNA